ncbi:Hypothetical predicted protein [Pelobates cultripes]|uniref:Uncharacterized protein n=1 Tax=Pelobates cultripes TaxID=61616 RepID=A0AAD1W159_PELCU|nr:Hypothetical predicted protein [Pelobates cultripes]
MLQCPATHKMLVQSPRSRPWMSPWTLQHKHTAQGQSSPATKLNIKNLLLELKQMSVADMDLMKTEVQVVTAHVLASEEDIREVQQDVKALKEDFLHHQPSHTALLTRFDMAEDRNRHNNLKIRGIPDSIGPQLVTSLPQKACSSTDAHAQAKKIAFDGFFHVTPSWPKLHQHHTQTRKGVTGQLYLEGIHSWGVRTGQLCPGRLCSPILPTTYD